MGRGLISGRWLACRGHLFPRTPQSSWSHPVLAPVSRGYPRPGGRLPTCYSPVRRWSEAEASLPLDLHVLSTPPAFVLSQDQTLQFELGTNRDATAEAADPTRCSERTRELCKAQGSKYCLGPVSSWRVAGPAGPHAIRFSKTDRSPSEPVWGSSSSQLDLDRRGGNPVEQGCAS